MIRLLCFILLISSTTAAAESVDIASFFPQNTVFYAEIRDPSQASKRVLDYIKGTILENPLDYFEKTPDEKNMIPPDLRLIFLAINPDSLAEFARFKGVAFGFTSVTKKKQLNDLFVIQPGGSLMVSLGLKQLLLNDSSIKKKLDYLGFPVYEEEKSESPNIMGQKETPRFYAWNRDLVLTGTNLDDIKYAINVFRQKSTERGFASSPAFQWISRERSNPALLFHADVQPLLKGFTSESDKAVRPKKPESAMQLFYQSLFSNRDWDTIDGRLDLNPDGIHLKTNLKLIPAHQGVLLSLLADGVLQVPDPTPLPKSAFFSATIDIRPGSKQVGGVIKILDNYAKFHGFLGPNATEIIAELKQHNYFNAQDNPLERIRKVKLVLPPSDPIFSHNQPPYFMERSSAALKKMSQQAPAIILEMTDAASAERVKKMIPKIFEVLDAGPIDPVQETVAGIKIQTALVKSSFFGSRVHYGAVDNLVGIAKNRNELTTTMNQMRQQQKSMARNEAQAPRRYSALIAFNWDPLINVLSTQTKPRLTVRHMAFDNGIVIDKDDTNDSPVKGLHKIFAAIPMGELRLAANGNDVAMELVLTDPRASRFEFLKEWLRFESRSLDGVMKAPSYFPTNDP